MVRWISLHHVPIAFWQIISNGKTCKFKCLWSSLCTGKFIVRFSVHIHQILRRIFLHIFLKRNFFIRKIVYIKLLENNKIMLWIEDNCAEHSFLPNLYYFFRSRDVSGSGYLLYTISWFTPHAGFNIFRTDTHILSIGTSTVTNYCVPSHVTSASVVCLSTYN